MSKEKVWREKPKATNMRIGQSIWSREDFNLNNPRSLLLFSTSSKSFVQFHTDLHSTPECDADQHETDPQTGLPQEDSINSSRKLFSNLQFRNRIYEQQQHPLSDGTSKIVYFFRGTKIPVDETGPFWPMAFPIKFPPLSFLSLLSNNKRRNYPEYYPSLGKPNRQTFDNQPAIYKYTDAIKHPILIYDMDKSPRQQQPKVYESEQMCPPLVFESRFEGGNLRQVKRV